MEKVTVLEGEGGMTIEEKLYCWKIKNFDEILRTEDKDFIQLQRFDFEFHDSNGAKSSWSANLLYEEIPKNEEAKDGTGFKKTLQIAVNLVSKPDSVSRVNGQVSIVVEGTNGKAKIIFSGIPGSVIQRDVNDKKTRGWNTPQLSGESQQPGLSDGTLVITIKLRIFTVITPVLNEVSKEMALSDFATVRTPPKPRFYRKITKLENDKDNSDLKIISSDGQEFYAYRWVLCEMSEVFEAMFRSNMKEKNSGVLKLEDLSGATVKLLVHFIYTGKLGPQWALPGTVEELTYAADKYQIQELQDYLDANLGKICTVENAGNFLVLAKKLSMEKAVADILAFIRAKSVNFEGFFEVVNNIKLN